MELELLNICFIFQLTSMYQNSSLKNDFNKVTVTGTDIIMTEDSIRMIQLIALVEIGSDNGFRGKDV
jgi:hypothetical protein